jgi:hypothetical protein
MPLVLYVGVLIRSSFGGVSEHKYIVTESLLSTNKKILAFVNIVPVF